jgi:hypothetical protein
MTPPKGTTNNKRTLTPLRTRSGGFPPHIQKLLLIDLVQQPEETPAADIVALRPGLYGDSTPASAKRRRAVRDRISYLRELKKSDASAFWYVAPSFFLSFVCMN